MTSAAPDHDDDEPGGFDDSVGDDAPAANGPEPWDLEFEPALGPGVAGPAPGVVHAEWPLRILTYLVDLLLAQVVMGVVISAVSALVQLAIRGPSFDGNTSVVSIAYLLAAALAWIPQAAGYVYALTKLRATPGQLFLGLFTLTVDGRPLPPDRALVRWLLTIAPALFATSIGSIFIALIPVLNRIEWLPLVVTVVPFIFLAALALSVVRDPEGRGVHDRLTKAVVVRRSGSPS